MDEALKKVSAALQLESGEIGDDARRRREALINLAISDHLARFFTEEQPHWAEHAAVYGATYADLGQAVGISRQAANSRWPGLARRAAERRARIGWGDDHGDEALAALTLALHELMDHFVDPRTLAWLVADYRQKARNPDWFNGITGFLVHQARELSGRLGVLPPGRGCQALSWLLALAADAAAHGSEAPEEAKGLGAVTQCAAAYDDEARCPRPVGIRLTLSTGLERFVCVEHAAVLLREDGACIAHCLAPGVGPLAVAIAFPDLPAYAAEALAADRLGAEHAMNKALSKDATA